MIELKRIRLWLRALLRPGTVERDIREEGGVGPAIVVVLGYDLYRCRFAGVSAQIVVLDRRGLPGWEFGP